MYSIKSYLEKDLSVVQLDTSIESVIQLMDELQLNQAVVQKSEDIIGVVFREDIEDNIGNPLCSNDIREKGVGINGDLHLYEGARLMVQQSLEILPVFDQKMDYVGIIRMDRVFEEIVKMTAVELKGGVILLRRMAVDYSMAEIARICESNDVRIISSGIMAEEDSNALIVTLRLDKFELGGVISSFERYEYEVIASFGDNQYKDYLKERFDLLMNYINM